MPKNVRALWNIFGRKQCTEGSCKRAHTWFVFFSSILYTHTHTSTRCDSTQYPEHTCVNIFRSNLMYANNVRVCHRLNFMNPLAFLPFTCCCCCFILCVVFSLSPLLLCSVLLMPCARFPLNIHRTKKCIVSSTLLFKVPITHHSAYKWRQQESKGSKNDMKMAILKCQSYRIDLSSLMWTFSGEEKKACAICVCCSWFLFLFFSPRHWSLAGWWHIYKSTVLPFI